VRLFTLKKIWIIAVSFVALVLCAMLFMSWLSGIRKVLREREKAVSVMTSFGDALVRQDYATAYRYMNTDAIKTQSLPDFANAYGSLVADEGAIQSISLGDYEVSLPRSSPWTASFVQEVNFPKGTLHFKCVLDYKSGDWKIRSCDEI
jgi:hypothetical protein